MLDKHILVEHHYDVFVTHPLLDLLLALADNTACHVVAGLKHNMDVLDDL